MTRKLFALFAIFCFVFSASPAIPAGAAPVSLTAEEKTVLGQLDYNHAWQQLAVLSTFPEKVGGSPEEAAAQQYVAQQFQQMDMDEVSVETFASQTWVQAGTRLKIASPLSEEIPVTAYGNGYSIWGRENGAPYSFGNRDNGRTLVAPVVNAGYGTAAEFAALGSLDGRIALVRRDDDVSLWPSVVVEEAILHGASAVVFYGYYGSYPQVDSPNGDATLPDSIKQDTVGGPLPAFSISILSAQRIKDLLLKGPVTLQLEGRADLISQRQGRSTNVIASLRGSKYPDEYVVISTHIDTWWTGTLDDLSGVAVVLETARLFSQARRQGIFNNERTLIFAVFGSEEMGGPQGTWFNWLIGSYEYVKAHPGVVDKTVLDLNLDMLSLKKSSGKYYFEQGPEANDMMTRAITDLGIADSVGFYNPLYSWVDGWSFYAKGGSTSINAMWVANADQIYHSQLDTMAYADPEPLKITLDVYTLLAVRADHALVLPVNLLGTVDWAAAGLAADRANVPSEAAAFNAASASLEDLRTQVTAVNQAAAQLQAAYLAAGGAEKTAIAAKAAALNQALFAARKEINVWSLGEGGSAGSWDVFLRTHQHAHDISYLDAALSALGRSRPAPALKALESVYSNDWGHLFSRSAYLSVMDGMMNTDMYWGAAWDQQQEYVDVQGIYLDLRDGRLKPAAARSALEAIRSSQLIPWLREDLSIMSSAWARAAGILASAMP